MKFIKPMKNSSTKNRMSNKRLSFIVSLFYVGIGTIYGLTYWTELNTTNAFSNFLFYIFMPASFLLEVILFSERNPFILGLLTQVITFFIFWGFVYSVLNIFRIDKQKLSVEEKKILIPSEK